MDERVTVVKLGGSIISDKKVDFSYRDEVVRSIGEAIEASGEKVVIVHGGGSFGHPVAKKYHLSSSKPRRSSEGVSETRRAMFELDARVCDSLLAGGLEPYAFSPYPLLAHAGRKGSEWLRAMLVAGLTPVTFGDVVHTKDGFRIISGDTISRSLSRSLGATRCVFVMDVDGILGRDGKVLESLDKETAGRLGGLTSSDATGGIALKAREALKMAASGTEVAFVSGFRPRDVSKALKRVRFHGTIVRVPSRD
jgi:isopentenyl phosphate kinase